MQLIDSTYTHLKARVDKRLLDVLEDIVHKVEIKPDFSIRHPDYKPLEIPADAVERFQKMPTEIQNKYLSLQLRNFLYGIYYNGSMRSSLALDNEENNLSLDLENNTVLGIDLGFYQRLHESNCGEGYFDPDWTVVKKENDGALAVTKGALRLHIQQDKHLQLGKQQAGIDESVTIRMPKNIVQNGFYMAVGNAGFIHLKNLTTQQLMVRIYFNLTPEGAIAMMDSLTQCLNEIEIPFSFKVLYNPKNYNRYDCGVLYFDKRDYENVAPILNTIYIQHQLYFKPQVPLFTKQLALGLGLAEEPDQKFAEQESFGMNRCQIVANGLLETWYQRDNSPEARIKMILEQFFRLKIDLQRIYLNANSKDIYTLPGLGN